MGTLNKIGDTKPKQASRIIKIALPRSNPNIKADIDAELDNGWHIESTSYDSTREDLIVIFTRPKRQA